MKANIILSKDEVKLIHEGLSHLYFEYDRESQAIHVQQLPNLKKVFQNKKKLAKQLLKRIEKCNGSINYLTSL